MRIDNGNALVFSKLIGILDLKGLTHTVTHILQVVFLTFPVRLLDEEDRF